MLYAAIEALGSFPNVALSSPIAGLLYLYMLWKLSIIPLFLLPGTSNMKSCAKQFLLSQMYSLIRFSSISTRPEAFGSIVPFFRT